MAYCTKCGTETPGGAQFCNACGTAITAPTMARATSPGTIQTDMQSELPKNNAEENKGMAALSYIIFFIPLLTGDYKKSSFVKFHANQGTLLFLATFALGVSTNIILAVFRAMFFNFNAWGIMGLLTTVFNALWLLPTVLVIIGIINASNGKEKHLPIIGNKFTIIK
jgi:uncharacterized membrane protein